MFPSAIEKRVDRLQSATPIPRPKEPRRTKKRPHNEIRQSEAYRLRLEGRSLAYIAEKLGYSSVHTACGSIRAYQDKFTAPDEPDRLRDIMVNRLDDMLAVYHPLAMAGDRDAARLCIAIEKRRSEMLGLDMPFRISVDNRTTVSFTITPGERPALDGQVTIDQAPSG